MALTLKPPNSDSVCVSLTVPELNWNFLRVFKELLQGPWLVPTKEPRALHELCRVEPQGVFSLELV